MFNTSILSCLLLSPMYGLAAPLIYSRVIIFLPLVQQRSSADTHSFCIILQKSASPLSLFFSTNKNSQLFPLHLSCFCLMSLLANNTKADFFFSCGWAGPGISILRNIINLFIWELSPRWCSPPLILPECGACCSSNIAALLVCPGLALRWPFSGYGTWLFVSTLCFSPSPLHPFPPHPSLASPPHCTLIPVHIT